MLFRLENIVRYLIQYIGWIQPNIEVCVFQGVKARQGWQYLCDMRALLDWNMHHFPVLFIYTARRHTDMHVLQLPRLVYVLNWIKVFLSHDAEHEDSSCSYQAHVPNEAIGKFN